MPIKKILKKLSKPRVKSTKSVATSEAIVEQPSPKFNEFGTCISCQGGNPNCLHNNLVQTNQGTFCVLCGFKVK